MKETVATGTYVALVPVSLQACDKGTFHARNRRKRNRDNFFCVEFPDDSCSDCVQRKCPSCVNWPTGLGESPEVSLLCMCHIWSLVLQPHGKCDQFSMGRIWRDFCGCTKHQGEDVSIWEDLFMKT